MALKATIFKVDLGVADMDRGHYGSYALTVARHPSETDERMMIRILAFAFAAEEGLEFGGGVSTPDEPDLWRRSLTGEIEEWIDLGQPDPRRIQKACGRSRHVTVWCYGGPKAATWWQQQKDGLARHDNLCVLHVPAAQSAALAKLAGRGITLQCNIQDGEVWVMRDALSVHATPEVWFGA